MWLFLAGLLEKLGLAWWQHHEQEANDPEVLERKEAAEMDKPPGPWSDTVKRL